MASFSTWKLNYGRFKRIFNVHLSFSVEILNDIPIFCLHNLAQGTLTFLAHSLNQRCKCSPEEFVLQCMQYTSSSAVIPWLRKSGWAVPAKLSWSQDALLPQISPLPRIQKQWPGWHLRLSQNRRTLKAGRDPGGHLVHHPCSSTTTYSPRTMSRQLFQWRRLHNHCGKPVPVLSFPLNESSVSRCLSLCLCLVPSSLHRDSALTADEDHPCIFTLAVII